LIEGLDTQHLLADKGYDSDKIVTQAEAGNMAVVYRRAEIANSLANTTALYTGLGIWWKTLSCTLRAGEALPPAMPKTPHHSWPPYKFAASLFGQLSYDDTI